MKINSLQTPTSQGYYILFLSFRCLQMCSRRSSTLVNRRPIFTRIVFNLFCRRSFLTGSLLPLTGIPLYSINPQTLNLVFENLTFLAITVSYGTSVVLAIPLLPHQLAALRLLPDSVLEHFLSHIRHDIGCTWFWRLLLNLMQTLHPLWNHVNTFIEFLS